jgi:ribose transport system substrate-binding protein
VNRRAVCAALVCCGLVGSGCKPKPKGPPGARVLQIAVIPKGTTHDFWKSIHAGARAGAAAMSRQFAAEKPNGIVGVEIFWKGPLREDDREQQIQVVEGFTAQEVDGIVLAPLDARALIRPVEEALRLHIPTVVIDSALDYRDIVSQVSTNNFAGGELAAEQLGKKLNGKGKAIMLRYQQGSASTEEREAGFLSKLKKDYPGIQLISDDQHGGPSRDTAKRSAENLLNRFGDEVQGMFGPNEPIAMGILLALQDVGRAGKVILIGFDSTPAVVQATRKGEVHGFVVQDPFTMGKRGVEIMALRLAGKGVPKAETTPAVLVTAENIDDPAIARLVAPVDSQ